VRLEIRDLIEEMRAEKAHNILMTTHYIEEAERLCDRVAIIDKRRNHRDRRAAGVCREKSATQSGA
jgi:ABC-2 type transport system ATP-binding protein